MPWFRLDDSFHSHPKVIAAGNEAIGLYVRCGTYAAQHLTDGFIRQDVALLYGSAALADKLVQTGLWRRTRGGWQIPDYLDYNPSAEQVKQERKQAAERQRRRREALMSRRDSRRDSRVSHTTPARPDPDPSTADAVEARAAPPTDTQRSKRITDAYAEAEPMCKWPAINGVVLKAIRSGRFADTEIRDALLRLAKEGRSVTVETLRLELAGMPPRGRHSRQAETDAQFERQMTRARAKEDHDPQRDGIAHPIRPRMLPAAGDG